MDGFEIDEFGIAAYVEITFFVEYISNATGHASCKVASGFAQNDSHPPCHILTSVIANAFDDRANARVAHAETFARLTANKCLPIGCTVEGYVADDDIVFGFKGGSLTRIDNQFAAAQSLAKVVIGVAFEAEGDARRCEGCKRLSSRSFKGDVNGVFRQTIGSEASRDFAAEDGSDHAVGIFNIEFRVDFAAILEGGFAKFEEDLVVHGVFETVILFDLAITPDFGIGVWFFKNGGQVQIFRFPVIGFCLVEQVGVTDEFIDGAHAELCHYFAHVLCDKMQEIDDLIGVAHEFFAQFGILRGHTHRAGIEVANAHHDAAHGDECCGGKSKLFGTEQSCNNHIASGFELSVGFDYDARSQIVEHEGLVGFGNAEFPG